MQPSLTIATRLATSRVTQLLDEQDLPSEVGQDQREGRRLAAITALGLAAGSAIVYALLQLHILPDDLTPWVFIMAFVSVFLGVFGKRSSARPLAVLRQRMAELGTSIDSPSSDMSEAGAESDTPEQLLRQSRAPSDTA